SLMGHDDADRIAEILTQTRGQLLLLRSVHHHTPNTRQPNWAGPKLGPRLLCETCEIDLDRRPHRRRKAHPLDVGAPDAARLAAGDRADKGAHIIDERVVRKARFADPGVDDAGLLGAELDLPA